MIVWGIFELATLGPAVTEFHVRQDKADVITRGILGWDQQKPSVPPSLRPSTLCPLFLRCRPSTSLSRLAQIIIMWSRQEELGFTQLCMHFKFLRMRTKTQPDFNSEQAMESADLKECIRENRLFIIQGFEIFEQAFAALLGYIGPRPTFVNIRELEVVRTAYEQFRQGMYDFPTEYRVITSIPPILGHILPPPLQKLAHGTWLGPTLLPRLLQKLATQI